MSLHKNHYFIGLLFSIIGAVLFSTKAIIIKLAFRDSPIDAISLLALRMAFALPLFLLAIFFSTNKKSDHALTKKQYLSIFILGLLGYYVSSLFDFIGLKYISAGLERLILFLYPTFVLLINHFVFNVAINKRQFLALILTYLGILIIFMDEINLSGINSQWIWGSASILLCTITYSIYIIGSGRILAKVRPVLFTGLAITSASCGVFVHFLISGQMRPIFEMPHVVGYGILLASIATFIPVFLTAKAIQMIGSNNVAIASSVGPVSTIFLAYIFLGELFSVIQFLGTVLVIAGVIMIGWRARQKQSVEEL